MPAATSRVARVERPPEHIRLRAIAHRLDVAATFAAETQRPAWARKLRDDAAWIRARLAP